MPPMKSPSKKAMKSAKKPVWVKLTAPDCGWVAKNPGSLTRAQIKKRVLVVAALPTGTPLSPSTPDDTPVTGGLRVGVGDQIYPLAQDCMTKDAGFAADGLRINRLYVLDNGKTLGAFVNCVFCSYQHQIKN
jgi:hypothetical protein